MAAYTVDTDGTSGDYSSLSSAVSAIVTAGEMTEDITVTCYATTSVDDTTAVDFEPVDTGAYRLTVNQGDTDYRLRVNVSGGPAMHFSYEFAQENTVTIDGLTIRGHGHTANYQTLMRWIGNRYSEMRVLNCDIRSESHTNREKLLEFAFDSDTYTASVVFVNNIVVAGSSSGHSGSRIIEFDGDPAVYLYNNTFVSPNASNVLYYAGATTDDDNAVFYNNVISGCDGVYNSYTPGTADYNRTDDTWDLGGTNDAQSQTFTFVGSGDYHLDSSDTGAIDGGTDLSSDGTFAFDYDIDGETRSGTWDAGADEYVSTSSTDDLTSSDLTGGTPTLDTPTIGQTHALTGSELTSGAPALDTPTIGQTHGLTGTEVTGGTPTLDTPTVGQTHGLTGTEITSGTPTLGTPTLAEGTDNLTSTDLTGSAPVFDTPTLGQVHTLTGSELTSSAPTLDTPTVGQVHGLTGTEITGGTPTLESPTVTEVVGTDVLTSADLLGGTPVLDTPTLGQVHALSGTDILGGVSIDSPALGQVHSLTATAITGSAPTLGEPTLSDFLYLFVENFTGTSTMTTTKTGASAMTTEEAGTSVMTTEYAKTSAFN